MIVLYCVMSFRVKGFVVVIFLKKLCLLREILIFKVVLILFVLKVFFIWYIFVVIVL